MPLMWQEGLLKGGQSWQALMDSSAFVNSLFLGSTISKHIYTVYSISSNLVCMFYFTMRSADLLKTVTSY